MQAEIFPPPLTLSWRAFLPLAFWQIEILYSQNCCCVHAPTGVFWVSGPRAPFVSLGSPLQTTKWTSSSKDWLLTFYFCNLSLGQVKLPNRPSNLTCVLKFIGSSQAWTEAIRVKWLLGEGGGYQFMPINKPLWDVSLFAASQGWVWGFVCIWSRVSLCLRKAPYQFQIWIGTKPSIVYMECF